MPFGEQVRILRTLKGLSQRELGRIVGISYTVIYQIENSYAQPSEAARAALIEALGITEERVRLLSQLTATA